MNEKKEFRQEITNLKETNKNMLSKNQKLFGLAFTQTKILIWKDQTLLARYQFLMII